MNKKIKIKSVVSAVACCLISAVSFGSYLDLGNKPLALGTAHTAITGDVYSLYSNPAGLYGGRSFDLKLDLLVNANLTGNILYNVNEIADSAEKFKKIRDAQEQGGTVDVTQVAALFKGIKNLVEIDQPGKGLLLQVNGGIGIKIKNFAFSVRNITNLGAKPVIDDNFLLGSVSTPSTPAPFIRNSLYLTNGTGSENTGGIVITTGTLNTDNSSLIEARNKLRDNVVGWLIGELEKLGVEIPDDIKNNREGIANALINLAIQQNVSTQEIVDAVNLLADRDFQTFISEYINRIRQGETRSFSQNNSGLIFKGVNYTELAVGYSRKFFDKLLIGASLKYLIARTLYYELRVFQESEEVDPDFLRETILKRLEKIYTSFGLDIGGIYELPVPIVKTNVGLVIRNLIEPRFKVEGTDEDIKLPRQVTAGISGTLWKRITLGIDLDLNDVETLVPGYRVQNLAIGLQLDPPILPTLRFGYLRNLKCENDYLYTVGLGIKLLILNFDIVGMIRPDEVKIGKETQIIPSNLAVGLTLGMRF